MVVWESNRSWLDIKHQGYSWKHWKKNSKIAIIEVFIIFIFELHAWHIFKTIELNISPTVKQDSYTPNEAADKLPPRLLMC